MGVARKSLWHLVGVGSGVGWLVRWTNTVRKPYPPRTTPFGMVFGPWVVRTTTVRELFNNTLRRNKI